VNPATLLHRQINPAWIQNERVTSQAFKPTPKDGNELSVYDGDLISAEGSWQHFTEQGMKSVGVLAVSVTEAQACGVNARPDPEPFPEHAVIDFTGLSSNQVEKAAKKLRNLATERGWQFRP
jgi:hypothetical protein